MWTLPVPDSQPPTLPPMGEGTQLTILPPAACIQGSPGPHLQILLPCVYPCATYSHGKAHPPLLRPFDFFILWTTCKGVFLMYVCIWTERLPCSFKTFTVWQMQNVLETPVTAPNLWWESQAGECFILVKVNHIFAFCLLSDSPFWGDKEKEPSIVQGREEGKSPCRWVGNPAGHSRLNHSSRLVSPGRRTGRGWAKAWSSSTQIQKRLEYWPKRDGVNLETVAEN